MMREGDRSPWGTIDHVTRLGPDVVVVETPSHGGLHFQGAAAEAVPAAVRATFIEGPTWAEEDVELPIALTFLHCRGHVDDQSLWLSAEKLRDAAVRNAATYERYKVASDLLVHEIPASTREPRDRTNGSPREPQQPPLAPDAAEIPETARENRRRKLIELTESTATAA